VLQGEQAEEIVARVRTEEKIANETQKVNATRNRVIFLAEKKRYSSNES